MNKAIAIQFVEYFCEGNIDQLALLLSSEFYFHGPLCQFNNANAYIEALRQDPPENSECLIKSITENESQVAIFYDYLKHGEALPIAQLFEFDAQHKIKQIQLVFDARYMD